MKNQAKLGLLVLIECYEAGVNFKATGDCLILSSSICM